MLEKPTESIARMREQKGLSDEKVSQEQGGKAEVKAFPSKREQREGTKEEGELKEGNRRGLGEGIHSPLSPTDSGHKGTTEQRARNR